MFNAVVYCSVLSSALLFPYSPMIKKCIKGPASLTPFLPTKGIKKDVV